MLTEQQLINGEVNASDDMDGMHSIIDNLWDEISRRTLKSIDLNRKHKVKEAEEMEVETDNISKELDRLIKRYTSYSKYLDLRNKIRPGKAHVVPMSPSKSLRDEKSSNGDIVVTIPSS